MPDAARIAEAQALEVPVTIQGTTTVPGTDRRELFSETAKTILVFHNGAVLNLRARVAAEQLVFLRNEQSGREILCRVMEAPPEGQTGHTDLEFTSIDPEFWVVDSAQPEASAASASVAAEQPQPQTQNSEGTEKPEAHAETETPAENSLAMMSTTASEANLPPARAPEEEPGEPAREELAPAPAIAPQTAAAPLVRPPEEKPKGRIREELVPAHEMVPPTAPAYEELAPAHGMVPETAPAGPDTVPTGEQIDAALRAMEPSDAKDKEHLAALMHREARLAKYAALKETAAAKIGRDPASQGASKDAPAEGEATELEAVPEKAPLGERLMTGKNAVIVEIAACVAIAVALGFIWHAVRGLFIHPSYRPVAAAILATKAAPPKEPPPVVLPAPAAAIVKVPAATPAAGGSGPVAKVVRSSRAPSGSAPAANRDVVVSAPAVKEDVVSEPAVEQLKDPEPVEPHPSEIVPAKIVLQSQPPLPPWARALDLDGVVKLDVVIDEKGNLVGTKVLSGPHSLQSAAEHAVQLWLFEPAQSDGKPIKTHMELTVEFQK
jgi:TonB family protein